MHERRVEPPIAIGLRHRRAMLEKPLRRRAAKILHEAEKRRLTLQPTARFRHRLAVVVSGDRENGRVVILVGLVELRDILAAFAAQIDGVAEMEQKSRPLAALRCGDLLLHRGRDGVLGFGAMDAASVAQRVKGECARLFRRFGHAGKDRLQRQAEITFGGRRQRVEARVVGEIRHGVADLRRRLCES